MLRVTVSKKGIVETWELEGKLSGEWVVELDRCWRQRSPEAGVTVEVHLKAVSYIDVAGKQLLGEMYEHGVEIKGCGCMARAVVEEIVRGAGARISQVSPKKILTIILFGICVLGTGASVAAREKSLGRPSVPTSTPHAIGNIFAAKANEAGVSHAAEMDHKFNFL